MSFFRCFYRSIVSASEAAAVCVHVHVETACSLFSKQTETKMNGKKNGVPDRWLDYKSVGKRLNGTRFIAFKVPLKQALTRQLPSSHVFGHWELLESLNQQNQELGLIIDLTNTKRYYTLQDVPQSLLVVKILTEGHHVPNDNVILSFKRVVRKFLQDNNDNDRLIGVHCTHGLNRTGYLICRYLVDVDGMDPEEAVQLFNSSRGHNMERRNYVTDLCAGPRRSNEKMDEPGQEPQRGEAHQPPEETWPQRDQGGPPPHSWNHSRSFSPRRPTHRRHHDDHHNAHSRPAPPFCPPAHPRTPPHPEWKRYPTQEEGRYRPPPREEGRYRPPPREEGRYKNLPQEDGRYRPPPREEGRYRHLPQEEDRYRPPPPEEGRYRHLSQEDGRYRPPPRVESRYRYPQREEGRYRPPSPGPGRSPACHMQQHRRGASPPRPHPPSLPRYTPRWATDGDGGEGN